MNMNEKLWKEFLKTPQTKKEKETLGEAVVAIVEETKERLYEGQRGMAFEKVVADVAQGKDPGEKGDFEMGSHGGQWAGRRFVDLAKQSLWKMAAAGKFPIAKDEDGNRILGKVTKVKTDIEKPASGGDPKTDLIIDDMKISLKLPGSIQFASGEGKSTGKVFCLVMQEYEEETQILQDASALAEKAIKKDIKPLVKQFLESLAATVGSRFYPKEKGSLKSKEMRELVVGKGYEALLRARAALDWKNNKYPSGGIPAAWEANGAKGPQDHFGPDNKEKYIEEFVNLALEKTKNDIPNLAKTNGKKWFEDFKKYEQGKITKAIDKIIANDPRFYYILIDEFLTGRRQFEGEQVADYLLSPDGFYEIKTREQTQAVAAEWKDQIAVRTAGKGRDWLGKSLTVRIDFKAEDFYKGLRQAAIAKYGITGVDIINEDNNTSAVDITSQAIAKDIVKNIEIDWKNCDEWLKKKD